MRIYQAGWFRPRRRPAPPFWSLSPHACLLREFALARPARPALDRRGGILYCGYFSMELLIGKHAVFALGILWSVEGDLV